MPSFLRWLFTPGTPSEIHDAGKAFSNGIRAAYGLPPIETEEEKYNRKITALRYELFDGKISYVSFEIEVEHLLRSLNRCRGL